MAGAPPRVEARHYESADWDTALCKICPQLCSIAPSRVGACGVRTNRHGKLQVDNYGKVAALQFLDGAELPLFHHAPGSRWLRLGMKGCTMRCPFCNTSRYSQVGAARTEVFQPAELAELALSHEARGISFGVNEPAVSHEFVCDVFDAAREAGLETHLATSGSWCEEPFQEVLERTTAMTFGFKGFSAEFLQAECGGPLDFIRLNAETAVARGVHVEATYLVLDGQEGWRGQLDEFGAWVEGLQPRMAVVLLPLEPAFTWKDRRPDRASVPWARERLAGRLPHVYILDPEGGRMDTHCEKCGTVLVRRGLAGTIVRSEGVCPKCASQTPFAD